MPTNVYSSAPWAETCMAKTGECLLTFTHPLPDGGGEHGETDRDRQTETDRDRQTETETETERRQAWHHQGERVT